MNKNIYSIVERIQIAIVFAVVLVVVGAYFSFPRVSHADTTGFSYNLYYGITNNASVESLQEFLTVQGDYSGPITGNFYSLTLAGVKTFQGNNGLPTTGYFGVLSRGVANDLLTQAMPSPSIGEVGSDTVPVISSSTPVSQQLAPAPSGNQSVFIAPQSSPVNDTPPTVALIVPVCQLIGAGSETGRAGFSWVMDPKATGVLSGYGVLPAPTWTQSLGLISVPQTAPTVTYVLTETVNDPTYQHTTTCSVTCTTQYGCQNNF